MSKSNEKKLESLTNQLVKLMAKIYTAQKILTRLENESDALLRRLLHRDDYKR